jgi:glutamine amidotransferase
VNGIERPRIVVVDYGAGNLRSVSRALAAVGADPVVSDRPADLATAAGVVLPGVGAAGSAMRGLAERGLVEPLRDVVDHGRPFLGVCLGLQVLLAWSEENDGVACLGVVPGRVVRLPDGLKIPHMGWNQVTQRSPDPLFEGIPDQANFYFVHSYVAVPDDPAAVIGATDYGVEFASVLRAGNVVATQFHPEKSADAGLAFYRNFTRWVRATASSLVGATREHA